jgi:serine/threonine protein kinase
VITFPFGLPERYKFSGERLEGGQGYVYICDDTFLARRVAIKVMKNVLDASALRSEFAALRDVWSQHTAEIYDLVLAKRSGMAGLVQEYVPGPSLEQYAAGELSDGEYIRTLWQLARGIADIHTCGKIHRDIKPSNVKFDAENVLKILDFGLSSPIDPNSETLAARGSRCYLAPEFYDTPPIPLTTTSDVYAFGVVAWCLATKANLPRQLRAVPPAKPPSIETVMSTLPTDIVGIIDSTLSANPADRPAMDSVRSFLERRLLHGKHRAVFCFRGAITELSIPGKSIVARVGSDSITILYDGLSFRVTAIGGDVFVNNTRVEVDDQMPHSCVITLGHGSLGYNRTFVTMDMSHPEVLL